MKLITKEEVYKKLGQYITTTNMDTLRGGKAANQFEVYYENGVVFQSYESTIVIKFKDGTIVLGTYYDYSKTTNKYRCAFLEEYMKETRQKLEDGVYLFCEEI